jgi:hypothetical protein
MPGNLVNISEVIVYGIIFDPKNSIAISRMDLQGLLRAVPRLFQMLDNQEPRGSYGSQNPISDTMTRKPLELAGLFEFRYCLATLAGRLLEESAGLFY